MSASASLRMVRSLSVLLKGWFMPLPERIGRISAKIGDPLDVPTVGQIQNATQVQKPGDQAALRIEIEFMQSALGLAIALHPKLLIRELKIGVQLKAAGAAQEVLNRHAPGFDIACGANRKMAGGKLGCLLKNAKLRKHIQVART